MSEIIESLAGIQAYFYIFADEIFFSREMNQEIMLGTASKSAFLPVFVFYQDFLNGSLTARSEEEKKKLINRLKRIEGQIRGIIGMMENDAYCNDILIQSAAVNAAVNAFNKELLASHIRTCVARDIREGKDETIDELVATLQKLMK